MFVAMLTNIFAIIPCILDRLESFFFLLLYIF